MPKGSLATSPTDFEERVESARRTFANRTQAEADVERVSFGDDGGVVLRVLVDANDLGADVVDGYGGTPIAIPGLTINGEQVEGAKLRYPQRSKTSSKVAFTLSGSVANGALPACFDASMSAKITANGPVFQGFKVVLPRS